MKLAIEFFLKNFNFCWFMYKIDLDWAMYKTFALKFEVLGKFLKTQDLDK